MMATSPELLLKVWREACKHIDITSSTASIASVLANRLPLNRILVQHLDVQRHALETVAMHDFQGHALKHLSKTGLSREDSSLLNAWADKPRLLRRSEPQDRQLMGIIAAKSIRSEAIAAPLWNSQGCLGALLGIVSHHCSLNDDHLNLFWDLAEPFAAALENDRRLRELKMLREAAEAERRSLLTRLGRSKLTMPIVGADTGLKKVLERVDTVCKADVPVLLLGQTGTGKEVIARAIHERSMRHDKPFIRVNCGAIPSELIDSQLFGHERGSFTGAVDTHQGWFERADGGTLLLDEIGELPLAAQVRLLRVLQDGLFERIGADHSIHVDVRIIAATHCDLAAKMRRGEFREDLWYRIAVFPIQIPLLRERLEDIPALALHFAEKAATRFGLPVVMPTPDDLRLLAGYPWPGNIRELSAVIDRAALLGNGRSLEIRASLGEATPMDQPPDSRRANSNDEEPKPVKILSIVPPEPTTVPFESHTETLTDLARRHIESALTSCRGRVEGPFGAAAQLGINPNTLRARMRKLGIDWGLYRKPGCH